MGIAKIQKGDNVKVISGKFRGTVGVVTKVANITKTFGKKIFKTKKVAVNEVAKLTKFRKASNYQGQSYPGEKFLIDRLIDASNVALISDDKNVTSKIKIEIKDEKKVRVLKKNNKILDKVSYKQEKEEKAKVKRK